MSNLRQIHQACVQYTVEYKGVYPWGFIYNRTNAVTGRPTDSGNSGYITWFSSCDKYMTSKQSEVILLDFNTGYIDGGTKRKVSQAFKCSAVQADVFKQQVHYYNHGVVMPHATLELPAGFRANLPSGGKMSPVVPAKVNQVYPDTALFWDAPLFSEASPETPAMFWGNWHTIAGYAAFCSVIDDNAAAMDTENGLLCHPEFPDAGSADLTRIVSPTRQIRLKSPSGPIAWASDEFLRALGFPCVRQYRLRRRHHLEPRQRPLPSQRPGLQRRLR